MRLQKVICIMMAASITMSTCPVKGAVKEFDHTLNQQQVVTDANTRKNQKEKVLCKKYSEQMTNGNFKEVYSKFSKPLKQQVTLETLTAAWAQTLGQAGLYQQYLDTFVVEREGMLIVSSSLQYEKRIVKVIYTFDEKGKISSIYLNSVDPDLKPEITNEYAEKSIEIGTYGLNGRLMLPVGVEKPPVVILIQGSGSHDMNESVKGNRPLQDIARGLAKQGIASIRYNKRFYQFPESADINGYTIQEEVIDDVEAAIEYAKTCNLVDEKHIVIAGHSLGGMVAPDICAKHPELAGMISLAGSPRHLADIMYDQVKDSLDQSGLDKQQKKASLNQYKEAVDMVKKLKKGDTGTYITVPASYWISLNQLDSIGKLKKIVMPMLFLQGRSDFQVKVGTDFTAWKNEVGGRVNCKFITYAKLNHLFMQTNGKSDITEYDVPGHVDESVINDMAAWIKDLK